MKARAQICLFFVTVLLTGISIAAVAKKNSSDKDENLAVVIGEAGEQYPIYGVGGIRVSGGHHGIFASNMKSSAIEVDGSGISAQGFMAINVNSDFTASAKRAYFVSTVSLCTLSSAADVAGQEIIVCNTGKNATITYQAAPAEVLHGGDQTGSIVNSTPGKVDRFISDGQGWYRE